MLSLDRTDGMAGRIAVGATVGVVGRVGVIDILGILLPLIGCFPFHRAVVYLAVSLADRDLVSLRATSVGVGGGTRSA